MQPIMKLRPTDDGQFEIVQTKPVVIATFPDQEIAKRFMMFLADETNKPEAKSEDLKPIQKTVEIAAPTKPKVIPITSKSKVNPVEKKDVVEKKKLPEWLDEDIPKAFERITAGEKIRDVAESFGKDWWSLRAKWANHKRNQKTVLEKVLTTAEVDAADMDECTMCGREFRPTANRLDMCARCDDV